MASQAAAAIPAILAAMQFLGGLFRGGDQELESFRGKGATVDPVRRLKEYIDSISEYGGEAKRYANEPVRLRSSFVQQPPVFTGGGLPMPIGLTGVDPALADPTLLEKPGFNFSVLPPDLDPLGEYGGGSGSTTPPGEPGPSGEGGEDMKLPPDDDDPPDDTLPTLRRRIKKPSDAAAAREAIQFLL